MMIETTETNTTKGEAMQTVRSITISTRAYELSHGHKPKGRGSWAFFYDGNTDVMNAPYVFWSAGNMTYSEALRDARYMARIGGHFHIEVGS